MKRQTNTPTEDNQLHLAFKKDRIQNEKSNVLDFAQEAIRIRREERLARYKQIIKDDEAKEM